MEAPDGFIQLQPEEAVRLANWILGFYDPVKPKLSVEDYKKELVYADIDEKRGVTKPAWSPDKYECTECGDIIQSKFSGDFAMCGCKSSYVDQTYDYTRLGGSARLVEDK